MPTEKIRNNYPDIAPPSGKYSRGIRAGNMLFISGCTATGTDADGKPMIDQMRATLEKLRRIVEVEGGSMTDIVKVVTWVTDIHEYRADLPKREVLIDEYYHGQYPTNTLVEIGALLTDSLNIEIDAIAVL